MFPPKNVKINIGLMFEAGLGCTPNEIHIFKLFWTVWGRAGVYPKWDTHLQTLLDCLRQGWGVPQMRYTSLNSSGLFEAGLGCTPNEIHIFKLFWTVWGRAGVYPKWDTHLQTLLDCLRQGWGVPQMRYTSSNSSGLFEAGLGCTPNEIHIFKLFWTVWGRAGVYPKWDTHLQTLLDCLRQGWGVPQMRYTSSNSSGLHLQTLLDYRVIFTVTVVLIRTINCCCPQWLLVTVYFSSFTSVICQCLITLLLST